MSDFSALEQRVDESQADTSILSENKVTDLVEYCRGNVIANEEQFCLSILARTTGWLRPFKRNVNTVKIGPSSGGKSHVDNAEADLLPTEMLYQTSDTSNMAVVDDDEWDETLVAPLDEWQKIPEKVTEIIKSVAGEDIKYTYKRNVQDDDSESGRSTHTIHKFAKPYSFLYAQFSMDNELWNRLLKLYVDDNEHIHRAIGRKEAGHDHISVEGYDESFVYDTEDLEYALREYFRGLPTRREELRGEERLLGGAYAEMPEWVWYAAEPIFSHARTETNRIYGMVFNLMRASAVLNYEDRPQVTVERGGDEVDAYVVQPQDVANVLSAQETLLGTTHELEPRKRAIVEAVRTYDGLGDEESAGCTVDKVQGYLKDSPMSVPKKQQLRDILEELAENYIVKIHDRAGPNGAHLYEFRSMRHIGVPRVSGLTEYMDAEEISAVEATYKTAGVDFDFDAPFEGCTDPYRDQPFVDRVDEMRDTLADDAVERAKEMADNVADDEDDSTDAAAFMGGDDGQATLGDDDGDGDTITVTPVENVVYDRLQTYADGEVFKEDHEEAHMLGIVDKDTRVVEANLNGSLLDPDHDAWDVSSKPDDWVTTEAECEARIEEAFSNLERKGVIGYDTDTPDAFVGIEIADVDTEVEA